MDKQEDWTKATKARQTVNSIAPRPASWAHWLWLDMTSQGHSISTVLTFSTRGSSLGLVSLSAGPGLPHHFFAPPLNQYILIIYNGFHQDIIALHVLCFYHISNCLTPHPTSSRWPLLSCQQVLFYFYVPRFLIFYFNLFATSLDFTTVAYTKLRSMGHLPPGYTTEVNV